MEALYLGGAATDDDGTERLTVTDVDVGVAVMAAADAWNG